ncbi:MAG TPA: two-component regulator propeller domain-containing protein [Thermoanaerobaculia bacterium]|nr:two-component regulator propeller domain-containing protein [Thermoanaerobaculia bacterium]
MRFGGRVLRCAVVLLAVVPQARAERLPLRVYTTADGLGSTFIERVVRDSRGFLWFCTREGLSRFDGYRFVTYGQADGLPNAAVNDIVESRPGEYWIATNGGGVCRFRPGAGAARFETFRTGSTVVSNRVNVLLHDRSGRVWAGSDDELFVNEGPESTRFREVPVASHSGILSLLQDREGGLWIGTGKGLVHLLTDGVGAIRYTLRPRLEADPVQALMVDREGKIWLGHAEGLMTFVPPPASQSRNRDSAPMLVGARWYSRADGLPSDDVIDLLQRRDGGIWVSTEKGLASVGPAGVRVHGKFEGVGHLSKGLAEDSAGNLWFGSSGGAVRWLAGGFSSFTSSEVPGLTEPLSLLETRNGELLIVDSNWTVRWFGNGAFHAEQPNLPVAPAPLWGNQGALLDRSGDFWIPTRLGLHRFTGISGISDLRTRQPVVYGRRQGLPDDMVYRLFEDSKGRLWIGTRALPGADSRPGYIPGLVSWDRASWSFRMYPASGGLEPLKRPSAFCEDRNGGVWIGFSEGGLARFHDGRLTRITSAEAVSDGMIWALYLDDAGRLWIGSANGGVARVDDPAAARPRMKRYTLQEGLSSNYVRAITQDRWGRIYLATARGVNRLDPSTDRVIRYTTQDGLANDFVTTAFRDRQGVLWFGTREGLSRLEPRPDVPETPPPVYIAGLRVGGSVLPVSQIGQKKIVGLELPASQSVLEIDFLGLGFHMGERLRYQFRLEGADADWGAPTEQRTTHYARVAPGRYRFQVRAVSATGLTSAEPAVVAFTVLPPLWRRGWFIALVTALALMAAYALHHYRLARVLEIERVRSRIATDLHDDIGAGLSRVVILSEVAKQQIESGQNANAALNQIGESARELIDGMSDVVWSIDPRHDSLEDVVWRIRAFASDVLESRGIAFDFDAPAELENVRLTPEQRRHIFLICKEAVNNATRHAGCASVRLSFQLTDHELLGRIHDDGRGFAAGTENAGHGVENMRARAESLGGSFELDSAPGRGTFLTFRVPL